MKPKDLRFPFAQQQCCVTIADRIWHIPPRCETYDNFFFPGWDSPELFGNRNPVYVECCSGTGTWIAAQAAKWPHINWVAVEKRFDRVRKIWSKLKNGNLHNLIVICGEAHNATRLYFPSESIQHLFINFPDPWPKRRHAKQRLMQPLFIEELARILSAEASLIFVTDDITCGTCTWDMLKNHQHFASKIPAPGYITQWDDYGSSYFEQLWRSKGRSIQYYHFLKNR